LITAAASVASTSSSVPNSSFEDGWSHGKVRCWNVAPESLGHLTVTNNAHAGRWAGFVAGKAGKGRLTEQAELMTDRSEACRVAVNARRSYTLNFWVRSGVTVQPVVHSYAPEAEGWRRWFAGAEIPPARMLGFHTIALPIIPDGVTSLSVGLRFAGSDTVVLDDVSLSPVNSTLFQPTFDRGEKVVTNEFAYWSPHAAAAAISPYWEMTSGSLFADDGSGWTGHIDDVAPDAASRKGTNSSVFRLNTREYTFRDVMVTMQLNLARMVSTPATPRVAWDGVHIFLRYQSQYELYYASVARRDGHVVIKKKCRGGRENGGTYYELGSGEVSGWQFPLDTWQAVGATVRTNSNGSVTIALYRNDKIVTSATDNGVGCAPFRGAGAAGIRGDNTEFRFRDFMIAPIV
jgi:hypothetical protein